MPPAPDLRRAHLPMLLAVAWKNVRLRYKSSLLGFAWTLFNPLLFLLIFLVVFSRAFPQVENYAVFALTGLVLIYAFAALGLFPTYFAMSQDLSVAHQGKVTGTLGAGAHLTLSLVVYPIQGAVIQATGSYDWVLALAGLFPLLGFWLMVALWPPERVTFE